MSRSFRQMGVALLLFCTICCGSSVARAQTEGYWEPTRASDFWEMLSPYGEWLDVPAYGRVWRPYLDYVGEDFTPYLTGGQWTYSDYGWYFSSVWDDSFGWAVFHYGRWAQDQELGWLWFPDVRWGSSWVQWNSNNDYVGWYPMAPSSIQLTTVSWIVVSAPSFTTPDLTRYAQPPARCKLVGRPVAPPRGNASIVLVGRGRPPRLELAPQTPPPPSHPSRGGPCIDCSSGGSDPATPHMVGAGPAWWAGGGPHGAPPRSRPGQAGFPVQAPSAPEARPEPPPQPVGPARPSFSPHVAGGGSFNPGGGYAGPAPAPRPVMGAAPVMRATPAAAPAPFRATPPAASGPLRGTPPGTRGDGKP